MQPCVRGAQRRQGGKASRACIAMVLSVGIVAMAGQVRAQVRPDAGSTQRDLAPRELELPRPAPALPTGPARPALKVDETQTFTVTAVRVTGNRAFASEVLRDLVQGDLVGRPVTLRSLQEAAAKITAYYRDRGYLVARAYIPEQRIDAAGAEIEIAVLEGVLGSLRIDNRSRLSEATVARFLSPLRPSVSLNLESFERPILLLSDQAGAGGVNPVLQPGEATGTSDLRVELGEGRLLTGQVEIDNHGNRFTSSERLSAQVSLASPFGLGESVMVRFTDSFAGLASASLRGAVPLGGNGWKVGASYSNTRYRLGESFAALNASGESSAAGGNLGYALVRSLRFNVNATTGYDAKRFFDRVGSTGTEAAKHTEAWTFTLAGDVREPWVADSVLVWSATGTGGRLALEDAATRTADATGARTQGRYGKFNGSLLYQQAIDARWALQASVNAQVADGNLDSSEKFSLGGAQGVRSYPSGEASGDEGVTGSLELRRSLPAWQGVQPTLVAFVDHGAVRVNKSAFASGANVRRIGAAGFGVTLSHPEGYSLRAYLAVQTTRSPATADNDRPTRFWLQLVKAF